MQIMKVEKYECRKLHLTILVKFLCNTFYFIIISFLYKLNFIVF